MATCNTCFTKLMPLDGVCISMARGYSLPVQPLAFQPVYNVPSFWSSHSVVSGRLSHWPVHSRYLQHEQVGCRALKPQKAAQAALGLGAAADIAVPHSIKPSCANSDKACAKFLHNSIISEAVRIAPGLSALDKEEKTLVKDGSNAACFQRRGLLSLAVASGFFAPELAQEASAAGPERGSSADQGGAADTNKGSRKANVFELKGGVRALDVRIGTGAIPQEGDMIAIHYYGRLGAKQGWRFDSSYEHKDLFGVPEPYVFTIGAGQVIAGIDTAVRSMHVGGIRRVVIPPDQGYQNKEQGPVPPDFFDRQRLYTTIFNPTRLANGEGATLGTVIFDLELVRIQS